MGTRRLPALCGLGGLGRGQGGLPDLALYALGHKARQRYEPIELGGLGVPGPFPVDGAQALSSSRTSADQGFLLSQLALILIVSVRPFSITSRVTPSASVPAFCSVSLISPRSKIPTSS
jgi:hypothetical protein